MSRLGVRPGSTQGSEGVGAGCGSPGQAARVVIVRTTVTATRPRAGRELALLAALYVAYSAARLLTDPDLGAATANARDLLHIEAVSGLDVERWLNEGLSALPVLPLVASYWYSLLHYAVTPAVLVWVYRAHPDRYRVARNSLVIGSALGIAGFALLPTAPPRMLPGYVDTLASTAGSGWWGSDASAPRGLGGLTNELAAMPSLHVGWALWCAVVVWWCTRDASNRRGVRAVRLVAAGYAAGTTLVVLATANHYVLDAVAGGAVLAVGAVVASALPVRSTEGRSQAGQRSSTRMVPSLAFWSPSRADQDARVVREQWGQSTTNMAGSDRSGTPMMAPATDTPGHRAAADALVGRRVGRTISARPHDAFARGRTMPSRAAARRTGRMAGDD